MKIQNYIKKRFKKIIDNNSIIKKNIWQKTSNLYKAFKVHSICLR
jgi:hypothetical protein